MLQSQDLRVGQTKESCIGGNQVIRLPVIFIAKGR